MNSYSNLFFVIAACIILALPAAGTGVLYYFTNDPSLRPLAITREKLADIDGQTDYVLIFVHVDWGREHQGKTTKAGLRQMISDTLLFRTDDFIFKFKEVPGDGIGVTFVVGPNRYGPYPPTRMIEGIIPALVALDYLRKKVRSEPITRTGDAELSAHAKFAAVHLSVHNLFNLERHLYSRDNFKLNRAAAIAVWRGLGAA